MAEIRLNVAGASPAQPPTNQISLYAKSTDKRLYVKDDTGAEVKLVTDEATLSDLTAQLPLTSTGGSTPVIAIANVTQTENGAMTYQDKIKLDSATSSNIGNELVQRDALGNVSFNEVTATQFIGPATTVSTIPALTGEVTSNGTNNVTTIASGVIDDNNISPTAGIALTKLATNPLDRSAHTGSQPASSISDFGTAIDTHLTNNAPIVNNMIDGAAGIEFSKLESDPSDRANHTGTQTAATISDFTTQVNTDIGNYLTSNPITNSDIDAAAAIDLSKLATNPLNRANHTGTQLASTISDFAANVPSALTGGDGIDDTELQATGTINVLGVVDQIDTSSGSVGIAATYEGQSSIITLGTITTGVWNGTAINVGYGGTGASSPGTARNNLLNVDTFTASDTISDSDNVILADATSSVITLQLPTASGKDMFHIKKIDASANNVVINVQSGDTIEGSTSLTLTTQYQSATLVSDGTNTWFIFATT